jgi:hypothetical protein
MFRSKLELRKHLAREVLGKDIGRYPPQKARRVAVERDPKYLVWIAEHTMPSHHVQFEGVEVTAIAWVAAYR